MPAEDITIESRITEDVLAKLDKLSGEQSNAIMRKATKAGAAPMLEAARAAAPVLSGVMQSKIQIRNSSSPSKGLFRSTVGVDAKDFTGNAFYAGFIMWGHFLGSRKLGNKRVFVPGNDFLRRAATNYADVSSNIMEATIIEGIEVLANG